MSSEWPLVQLGQLTVNLDSRRKPVKEADRRPGPYPYYGASGVVDHVDGYLFEGEHLLVAEDGENLRTQQTPIAFLANGKFWVNNHAHIVIGNDRASTRFLLYALLGADISAFLTGAVMPKLTQGNLNRIEVACPPRYVQDQVVAVLGSLDDRISLLRETNATLESIAQALFKSWFVDFDPVRAKRDGRVPEAIDEATSALFPDNFEDSNGGGLPKAWGLQPFGEWLSVLETGRRPKGGVAGIDSGVPSIGAESIVKMGEFDYAKVKFVSAEFFANMKAGKLLSRDVLLYKDGGKPGVFLPRVSMFGDGFPFETCGINEHVFRIRVKPPFGQVFVYFWLWSDAVMHELKHRGGKAAIPGINQADVRELRILVPPDELLKRYEEITEPIVGKILDNSKRIKVLSELRDTLLPRLVSGQLQLAAVESEIAALQ
jgi:type I restriction enzyme S subunit